MCVCGTEAETSEYFVLRCQFYSTQRSKLFENLEKVETKFSKFKCKESIFILFYGSQTNNSESLNQEIL